MSKIPGYDDHGTLSVKPSHSDLRHAAGALGAVGRNLNQIARVAHQTGRVGST
jgi:hypothetical protein